MLEDVWKAQYLPVTFFLILLPVSLALARAH
jgi:hypothetical protein